MIVSCLLLIATLLIYGSFRELRNLPGKCLMFFVLSQLIIYIVIPIMKFNGDTSAANEVMAIFLIFGINFSFMWFSVLCFDVWWSLR